MVEESELAMVFYLNELLNLVQSEMAAQPLRRTAKGGKGA